MIFLSILNILPFLAEASSLPLRDAQEIVQRGLHYAQQKGWKVSIAIVNSEGQLLTFVRDDGAHLGSVELSVDKAKSAQSFRRPTRAFVEMIQNQGKIGLLTGKGIVAIEGGLPIFKDHTLLGAIGVSGAKAIEDEEVALAAITPDRTP